MINAKDKGTGFEREIVESLKNIDPKIRRSIMSGAIGNILETERGDINNSIGLCIECKRTEKLKPYDFYTQAKEENNNPNKIPIVVMRSNNREALALLSWEDFLAIYKKSIENGLLEKPQHKKPNGKPPKLSLEETAGLKFSKLKQTQKKTTP